MVQWLRLCSPTVGATGLIPGQGTRIPHATWSSQKIFKNKKARITWEESIYQYQDLYSYNNQDCVVLAEG